MVFTNLAVSADFVQVLKNLRQFTPKQAEKNVPLVLDDFVGHYNLVQCRSVGHFVCISPFPGFWSLVRQITRVINQ